MKNINIYYWKINECMNKYLKQIKAISVNNRWFQAPPPVYPQVLLWNFSYSSPQDLPQHIQRHFFHCPRRHLSKQGLLFTEKVLAICLAVFLRRAWRLSKPFSSGVRVNVKNTEMWPSATWPLHSEMDWPSALLFTDSDRTSCKSRLHCLRLGFFSRKYAFKRVFGRAMCMHYNPFQEMIKCKAFYWRKCVRLSNVLIHSCFMWRCYICCYSVTPVWSGQEVTS